MKKSNQVFFQKADHLPTAERITYVFCFSFKPTVQFKGLDVNKLALLLDSRPLGQSGGRIEASKHDKKMALL